MGKSWIHSSVATLEANKSENWLETKCYKFRTNQMEVILEWFLTKRTASIAPTISIITLSLLKIRAFFKRYPMFASLFRKNQ